MDAQPSRRPKSLDVQILSPAERAAGGRLASASGPSASSVHSLVSRRARRAHTHAFFPHGNSGSATRGEEQDNSGMNNAHRRAVPDFTGLTTFMFVATKSSYRLHLALGFDSNDSGATLSSGRT